MVIRRSWNWHRSSQECSGTHPEMTLLFQPGIRQGISSLVINILELLFWVSSSCRQHLHHLPKSMEIQSFFTFTSPTSYAKIALYSCWTFCLYIKSHFIDLPRRLPVSPERLCSVTLTTFKIDGWANMGQLLGRILYHMLCDFSPQKTVLYYFKQQAESLSLQPDDLW